MFVDILMYGFCLFTLMCVLRVYYLMYINQLTGILQ